MTPQDHTTLILPDDLYAVHAKAGDGLLMKGLVRRHQAEVNRC